jgi:hypothetical protein
MPVVVCSVAGKVMPSDGLTAALTHDPGTRDAPTTTADDMSFVCHCVSIIAT